MARIRILFVALVTVLCVGVCADGSLALAAHASSHRRAHRAALCGKAARKHSRHRRGHASSKKRHAKVSCAKHHTSPAKQSSGAGAATPTAGASTRSKSATTSDDSCTDANLQPTQLDLERIRAATLCLVNRERAANGEGPLHANPHLQQAAQGHTESMVDDNYFEHVGPQGETPLQRMRAAGYIYSTQIGYAVGENLAWGTLWLGTPRAIVASWMASPPHRANILDRRYRDTGIGVSPHPPRSLGHGQIGGIYTQDFGVIVGG